MSCATRIGACVARPAPPAEPGVGRRLPRRRSTGRTWPASGNRHDRLGACRRISSITANWTGPAKLAFLQTLSVLSVPAPYAGPKGLFLLEAMASGVPVVQPRSGAFTEMVETTGGGILVEPGNPDAVAEGILELWKNPDRRRELGNRGFEGVRAHYSSERMLERTLEVYRSVLQ